MRCAIGFYLVASPLFIATQYTNAKAAGLEKELTMSNVPTVK